MFCALSDLPHCVFLDSAQRHPKLGRYSYVAADPFAYLQLRQGVADPLRRLQEAIAPLTGTTLTELPVFQGGAAGLFSYDLGRTLEVLPSPRCDDFQLPTLAVGLYDVVVAFDHLTDRAWIISQGWPATLAASRSQRAAERLRQFRVKIESRDKNSTRMATAAAELGAVAHRIPLSPHAENFAIGGLESLRSNFTADGFCRAVEQAMEYIRAGDIFQVNLAQRLLHPAHTSTRQLYLRLRQENPAPFAGYFDLGDIKSSARSPERFLKVKPRNVETRPIKGTRPRRRGD